MYLVSIIIPCYNSGATLRQAVDSAKAQTWPNIEIIVVDDGSTDSLTREVMVNLSDITLVRQPNLGLPAARNAGFVAARGTYVFPLDADDWIEPDAITTLVRAVTSFGHKGFAYCDAQLEGEEFGVLQKNYNYFEQLFLNQLPYCLLIRKHLWEEVGGYDESMTRGYEDWEFNIRLGWHGYHGLRVPHPLFHYRVSSSGMLMSKSNRLHGRLWAEIQSKHPRIYRIFYLGRLWKEWRDKPSNYPLVLYSLLLCAHRICPNSIFSILFRWLRFRRRQFRVISAVEQ